MDTSSVEKIKDRLDVVEVVGSYVELKQAGSYLKGLCPFHKEKTPSFTVSPSRGTFYCFGCGAKGDIFSFVQQFQGLDFPGALKILADRAGVDIDRKGGAGKDEHKAVYTLLEKATGFFHTTLTEGVAEGTREAMQYLQGRGVSEATVAEWKIGYASQEWRALLTHLTSLGVTEEEIEKAGLLKRKTRSEDGSQKDVVYDTFRGRVIFPIADTSSRVVGFSGRAYPDDETLKAPKYLNSPDTEVFNKSEVLYGLGKAMSAIRRSKYSVMVEGQFDLILSHQVGLKNTVALSGTALTRGHLDRLKRLSPNMVIAFDSDEAGRTASHRASILALSHGMQVKIAPLPQGADPADIIQRDISEWKQVLRSVKHPVEFFLDRIQEEFPDRKDQLREIKNDIFPLLLSIESEMDRSYFISLVADQTGFEKEAILHDLEAGGKKETAAPEEPAHEPPQERTAPQPSEKVNPLYTIASILKWQRTVEKSILDPVVVEKKLREDDDLFESVAKYEEAVKEEDVFTEEVSRSNYTQEELIRTIDELILYYRIKKLKNEFDESHRQLHEAETEGNEERVKELLARCRDLSRSLETLKDQFRK